MKPGFTGFKDDKDAAVLFASGVYEVCHEITPKDKVLLLSLPCFLSFSLPQKASLFKDY